MKKNIIVLLLLLLSTLSIAQVQNKFFGGAVLGKSSTQSTYLMMANYFGKAPTNYFGILCIGDVVYAKYKWDAVNVHFHNDKFAQVNLRYVDWGYGNKRRTSDDIYQRYLNLNESLVNKYFCKVKSYIAPQEPGQSGTYYTDGKYAVSLILKYRLEKNVKVYTEVQMWYWDVELMQEPPKPQINDDL